MWPGSARWALCKEENPSLLREARTATCHTHRALCRLWSTFTGAGWFGRGSAPTVHTHSHPHLQMWKLRLQVTGRKSRQEARAGPSESPGLLPFPSLFCPFPQSVFCDPVVLGHGQPVMSKSEDISRTTFSDPPPCPPVFQRVKLRSPKGTGTPMITSWQVPELGLEPRVSPASLSCPPLDTGM